MKTAWPVLALLVAGCACPGVRETPKDTRAAAPAPDAAPATSSCPELADTCPAGCFPVGAHPIDPARKCRLPLRNFGCSATRAPGPPGVLCTVDPRTGQMWVSLEARGFPGGRVCTDAEIRDVKPFELPPC